MTSAEVIRRLHEHGVRIERHGDRLKLTAAKAPPDELLQLVRAAKPELLVALPDSDRAGRAVVRFRLRVDPHGVWHHCLGVPGGTEASVIAELADRFRDRLEATQVRVDNQWQSTERDVQSKLAS